MDKHEANGAIFSRRKTRYFAIPPGGGVREVPVSEPLKRGWKYATSADITAAKLKAAEIDGVPPAPAAA